MRKQDHVRIAPRLLSQSSSLGAILFIVFCRSSGIAQTPEKWIGVSEGHCSEIRGNPDNQTFACLVWDRATERFSEPRQIEIYRGMKRMQTIEPGKPILEWHFWKDGEQLAVHSDTRDTLGTYALYDTTTGVQIDRASDSIEPSGLPQWAKSRSQLEDESVSESSALFQQRNMCLAKVYRKIETIHPGMKRSQLTRVFTPDGGLHNRLQRTYVSIDCPYIKVDIRFKAYKGDTDVLHEDDLDDTIESVSRPYLGWGVAD
jgi:hypothetical protein